MFERRTSQLRSPILHGRSGLSLVEIMAALMILSVAVYILTSTVMATVSHSVVRGERERAVEAAMNMVEGIRALPQQDVFALFNGEPGDDPYGAGTGPGRHFEVPSLNPIVDDKGVPRPVGTVLLPGTGSELIETATQPEFGLPRDLDGNLIVSGGNVANRYIVLPLIVRVEWESRLGPRKFELPTMLADMAKWQD